MSVPVLVGESVVLRPVRPEDRAARRRHGWHADIERNDGSRTTTRAMTDDEAAQWYARWELAADDPSRLGRVIDLEGEVVGAALLHAINTQDRRARYAIGLFAPSFLGRGLGRQATRLVPGGLRSMTRGMPVRCARRRHRSWGRGAWAGAG